MLLFRKFLNISKKVSLPRSVNSLAFSTVIMYRNTWKGVLIILTFIFCSYQTKMEFDKEELKKRLTKLQYEVTQNKETERPYTGEYDKHFKPGEYECIVCSQKLFT